MDGAGPGWTGGQTALGRESTRARATAVRTTLTATTTTRAAGTPVAKNAGAPVSTDRIRLPAMIRAAIRLPLRHIMTTAMIVTRPSTAPAMSTAIGGPWEAES